MPNSFYAPGPERAAKVRALFDAIARRYDLVNDLQSFGMHRLWKSELVQLASAHPGHCALDLCCGTGDIALRLARSHSTIGLDFSGPMLAQAQRRAPPRAPVAWIRGDALRLPFFDGSFDCVTVGYGLRNLADLSGGLAEFSRVLRPGGALLILDFSHPKNPVWRRAYFFYLHLAVPVLGRLFAGSASAYAYILESLRHFPAPEAIVDELHKLGFAAGYRPFLGGVMALIHGTKKR